MEDDYLNGEDFELTDIPQESPFEAPQKDYDEWGTDPEPEYPQYGDDDPWLTENPFAEPASSDSTNDTVTSDNDWTSSSISSNNDDNTEDNQEQQKDYRSSAISFTGYGRCSCGCGSFGGHGDICTYCGHPYSAHSRYKK